MATISWQGEWKGEVKEFKFGREYRDISIPIDIHEVNKVQAFGLDNPQLNVICSTDKSGSVNCSTITITPHGNCTHTEGVGHISLEGSSILSQPPPPYLLSVLLSVTPSPFTVEEHYDPPHNENDLVITKQMLIDSFSSIKDKRGEGVVELAEALLLRTQPNSLSKKHTVYSNNSAPYFTDDAMQYLLHSHPSIKHLLVDLPSVDRENDSGHLANHSLFFGLPKRDLSNGLTKVRSEREQCEDRKGSSITELCYFDDDIYDDIYLLNLQLSPLHLDAAPSRPLLFPLL